MWKIWRIYLHIEFERFVSRHQLTTKNENKIKKSKKWKLYWWIRTCIARTLPPTTNGHHNYCCVCDRWENCVIFECKSEIDFINEPARHWHHVHTTLRTRGFWLNTKFERERKNNNNNNNQQQIRHRLSTVCKNKTNTQ